MNIKKWVLLSLMSGVVVSCGDNYTTEKSFAEWYYICDNKSKQKLTWLFNEGELGEYYFEGGSVMKPVNPEVSKTLFKRQDGVEYNITGDSNAWIVNRVGTNTHMKCSRVLDLYAEDGRGGNNNTQLIPALPVILEADAMMPAKK